MKKITLLVMTLALVMVASLSYAVTEAIIAHHHWAPMDGNPVDGTAEGVQFAVQTRADLPAGMHLKGHSHRVCFAWDLGTTYTADIAGATLIELRLGNENRAADGVPNPHDIMLLNSAEATSQSLTHYNDAATTIPLGGADYFNGVADGEYGAILDITTLVQAMDFSTSPFLIIRIHMTDGNGFVNGVLPADINVSHNRIWVGAR